ncbi:hypothetical protein D3C81_999350 [compost metagenome]
MPVRRGSARIVRSRICKLLFRDHGAIDDHQHKAEDCHHTHRPAPAKVRRNEAGKRNAEHRPKCGCRRKAAGNGRSHTLWKDAQEHSESDAAVGSLADTDEKARDDHLMVVAGDGAPERGNTPHCNHQSNAFDASPTVRDDGEWESQHADRQRHDAADRAELCVRNLPLRFQERKQGIDRLPRHVVRQHQAKHQGKHHPRVSSGAGAVRSRLNRHRTTRIQV